MPGLALFAATVFAFHHLPALAGAAGVWIDLLTPFAAGAGAAAVLAPLSPRRAVLALAVVAGLLYADGHGIHLAANSIRDEGVTGRAAETAFFWDERFGHVEWHTGWLLLVAAFCLAEVRTDAPRAAGAATAATAALLLGLTLFTSTVEGGDWWLVPPAAALLATWALARPRPLLRASALAFVLAAVLMGVWALWHGGMPEFSELGWI